MKRKDGRDRVKWSDEEVKTLIDLWQRGYSYGQIAAKVDHPRNSVASKLRDVRNGIVKLRRVPILQSRQNETVVPPTSCVDPRRTMNMRAVDRFGKLPIRDGFR
jgi:hypothetical protein